MATTRTNCQIWRSEGLRKTTEGELVVTSDDELGFVVDDDIVWMVPAAGVVWKHPWYSAKAAMKITEPELAQGLYMAYSPRNRGTVGNAIDTGRARTALRHITDRLARLQRAT